MRGHMAKRPTSNQLKMIEFEAFKALSGADYVRQRLLHGLSMGTPSIETQAYLIKSRVKDASSLVTKVLDRKLKGKSYSASHARDIVGLRLLVLFKSELPLILNRFLDFVRWSQQPPFSLFYGETLQDSIEEIVIYPVADELDPNLGFFLDQFEKFGFFYGDRAPENRVSVQVLKKQSRYSSIHIVLWANGPTQSLSDRVPVEVQLRTSLEDVWGEVEHRLRYKSSRRRKSNGGRRTAETEGGFKLVYEELENLKLTLDSASNTSDALRRWMDNTVRDNVVVRSYTRNVSFDMNVLRDIGLPQHIMESLQPIIGDLMGLYHRIFTQTDINSGFVEEALSALRKGSSTFAQALRSYQDACPEPAAFNEKIEYHLRMEKAACLYWTAVMLHGRLSGDGSLREDTEAEAVLNHAFAQYRIVSRLPSYSGDPVISFRVGNALTLAGDHDYALLKYSEAYDRLLLDRRLAERHQMRIVIPRQYAFSLWHAAERAKWRSGDFGDVDLFGPLRLDQYLKALDVSRSIYGFEIDERDIDGRAMSQMEENRVTANNIVFYACSFLTAGGDGSLLRERGIDPDRLRELIQEVGSGEVRNLSRLSFADTIRQAARILGDRSLATSAATRVLELVAQTDFGVGLPDRAYIDAREQADEELATGLGMFKGYPLHW